MCKAEGFHLTKFICNDKKVFATIPEEDRRQGVKNREPSNRKSSWNTVESGT